MNAFRLLGDLAHLGAMSVLLMRVWTTRSVAGLSMTSQQMILLAFITRFADLMVQFVSPYNTMMKLFFVFVSGLTNILVKKFKTTYNDISDTFRMELLVLPAAGLACLVNHDLTVLEVMWTFSIYIEAVAFIPQLFMTSKTGEAETMSVTYLAIMAAYRAFYFLNWIYRFYTEHYFDLIAVVAGSLQTLIFLDFFYLYLSKDDLFSGGGESGEAGESGGDSTEEASSSQEGTGTGTPAADEEGSEADS